MSSQKGVRERVQDGEVRSVALDSGSSGGAVRA